MATNKHAVIRYQALDKCFSNFGRKFYMTDLIDACNDALYDFTGIEDGVHRRQVFADINFMESDAGYSIPLERLKDDRKIYYRYDDKNFSINKKPLSPTEAEQLKNTIIMLNRFKGLPQFDWMDVVMARLEDTFKLKANVENTVSFEQNPYLRGLEHFTGLFNAIVNKQVLSISYKPAFQAPKRYTLHPYHLKQFNNRWFLFGLYSTSEHPKVINMAIDRIDSFETININYIENTDFDFNEFFDDVIGVSVVPGTKPQTILLKIDNNRYNYIESKPIHHSQKVKERHDDYTVIELQLIPNYEFETLLLGFADSIEILQPQSLKFAIKDRAKTIYEKNK